MKRNILIFTISAVVLCLVIVGVIFCPAIFGPKATLDNVDLASNPEIAKYRANFSNLAEGFFETEADERREKILTTGNTEEFYEITGTKYYISSSTGDDSNDGLSPEAAVKSVERLEELYTVPGDAFLFKRGDTFRFKDTFILRQGITYGSYGEGAKPKLYGSPENYAQNTSWEKETENIWKIAFDYPTACGLVINHSEIIGVNKYKGIGELKENGNYYHDDQNGIFYMLCDMGKPCEVYKDIEIMPSYAILSSGSVDKDITVDNLCIKYAAGGGVSAINPKNFTVTNCEFGFLGGWWLDAKTKELRFGNSVEFWGSCTNIKVDDNWIYQTYDSGVTWQSRQGAPYKNISFSGNLFEYNNADIEFFDRTTSTLENFRMENNIMRFTSMGWGTRETDGGIRGIEGCIRAHTNGMALVKDVYFTNNIMDCPARQTINWDVDPWQWEGIHASGSKLYIKNSYRTLKPYLQGLQTEEGQEYDRRFAETYEELVEGFKIFEQGADIYVEE